jgi:hypothetical protein
MTNEQEQQGKRFAVSTIAETDSSITIQVSRDNETVVFTYTPPHKVVFDFPAEEPRGEAGQPQTHETKTPPEYPAITIEGNPVFKHKLEKGRYSLRLAYHPNPKNTAEAQFYNVVADGEKAKEFYGLYITDTRMQLHVTGSDISGSVKKRQGTAGTIRADTIEIIRGRKARSGILHEKIRLDALP